MCQVGDIDRHQSINAGASKQKKARVGPGYDEYDNAGIA